VIPGEPVPLADELLSRGGGQPAPEANPAADLLNEKCPTLGELSPPAEDFFSQEGLNAIYEAACDAFVYLDDGPNRWRVHNVFAERGQDWLALVGSDNLAMLTELKQLFFTRAAECGFSQERDQG